MIKLFLISWTAFVLAEFDTMAQCLIVQEKIDANTYYNEFRTLCLEVDCADDAGSGSDLNQDTGMVNELPWSYRDLPIPYKNQSEEILWAKNYQRRKGF